MERAVARIDFDAVRANCARLSSTLGEAQLCAVVKADGYGHGAEGCAQAALAGGAARFAVATATEAEALSRRFIHVPLLTMGALTAAEVDVVLAAHSEVAVWREGFRAFLSARAEALGTGRPVRVHVKYDSGMGRLGNPDPEQVLALARACDADPNLELAGVWTHFATADELDSEFFEEQLRRFEVVAATVKEEFPTVTAHAANSAAVLREPRAHFDMARCGVAIYGLDPFQRDPAEQGLLPALSLRSHVADVKRFAAGASAGYGQRWQAPEETWVGVIPLGYGDGVRRALTNNAEVLIRGRRHPLVGTVSMDNITVDLGPQTEVQAGDEAVLIGSQGDDSILAEEVAARLDTINYEVTCGISARVPRRAA